MFSRFNVVLAERQRLDLSLGSACLGWQRDTEGDSYRECRRLRANPRNKTAHIRTTLDRGQRLSSPSRRPDNPVQAVDNCRAEV